MGNLKLHHFKTQNANNNECGNCRGQLQIEL